MQFTVLILLTIGLKVRFVFEINAIDFGSKFLFIFSSVQTVAKFGLIGDRYALRICTVYGVKWWVPETKASHPVSNKMTKGFSVRLRINSLMPWTVVCLLECVHLTLAFLQILHEFDDSLKHLMVSNSDWTADCGTHPRSHCSDFKASSFRCFDSSHIGDSGI